MPNYSSYQEFFDADGVVVVRNCFRDYIDLLKAGLGEVSKINPPMWGNNEDIPADQSFDNFLFPYFYSAAVRTFIEQSPIGEIVGTMLCAHKARMFFDQFIVRRNACQKSTEIHQDLPFWPIVGHQTCGISIPLEGVNEGDGPLFYLPGSHKMPVLFSNYERHGLPLMKRSDFAVEALTWSLSQGDAVLHNPRTAHWSGPCKHGHTRAVYIAAFVGECERFLPRPAAMRFPIPLELDVDAQIAGPMFPIIWSRQDPV